MPISKSQETYISDSLPPMFETMTLPTPKPWRILNPNGTIKTLTCDPGTSSYNVVTQPARVVTNYRSRCKHVPYRPGIDITPLPYIAERKFVQHGHALGVLTLWLQTSGLAHSCGQRSAGIVPLALASSVHNGDSGKYQAPSWGMYNATLVQLSNRIQKARANSVNWMANAMEFKQSSESLKTHSRNLFSFFDAMHKYQFERAYRALFGNPGTKRFDPLYQKWRHKGVRSKYTTEVLLLEWSYGLGALGRDIYESFEKIMNNHSPLHFKVTATGKEEEVFDLPPINLGIVTRPGGLTFNTNLLRQELRKTKLRFHATIEVRDTLAFDLTGAGIYDPFSVAWETLGWTFLIDWFSNIGGVIKMRSLANGIKVVHACQTLKQESMLHGASVTGPRTVESQNNGQCGKYDGISLSRYAYLNTRFERSILASIPYANLYINPDIFNLGRAANFLALATARMRKVAEKVS